MRPVLAGIALGAVLSMTLTRVMSNALYGVISLEPGTFAGVLLLLSVSAYLACYLPARRASSIDPIISLREE